LRLRLDKRCCLRNWFEYWHVDHGDGRFRLHGQDIVDWDDDRGSGGARRERFRSIRLAAFSMMLTVCS
jgi:hypothetical protein